MLNPFIVHEGQVYIIQRWDEKLKGTETLTIRPLNEKEQKIWRQFTHDINREIWAMIDRRPAKRSSGR